MASFPNSPPIPEWFKDDEWHNWFAWFDSLSVMEQRDVLVRIPQVAAALGYGIDEDALAAEDLPYLVPCAFAPVSLN